MSLRAEMPVTAWLIDELRRKWGQIETDALVRATMRGEGSAAHGRMHMRETGPDGITREFGQPLPQASGSFPAPRSTGNSSRDRKLVGDQRKSPTVGPNQRSEVR